MDLFVCLNLTIKDTESFDLDDFLYLFDNFNFMIESKARFEEFLKFSFKINI